MGSWFRAILEQNLTRVKGEKLQVCYKTFLNEDGVNPYKETIERCFIRPVPLECLNEGVVFKEGSVVDAYFSDGWWTVVIAVERQMVLNQHMFRKGKLVKMTRKISESKVIWVRALYSLNDFVEVFVTHGLRKARVMEILIDNHYKVYFEATKENATLSSVNQLGTFFGIRDDEIQFPLFLHWIETKSLTIEEVNRFDKMKKVDVKCILGDPELHSDLVEDVDSEFGRVVDLVKREYRLKRQDWLNGSVDIAVAEAEVDENNPAPGIGAVDQEKIEILINKVVSLEKKVKYLEDLLNIRGETVKGKKKGVNLHVKYTIK
ncbi:LOW QUALITY PROTEIN: hypothetical protein HID58_088427 [Brassica napus]|uniref:Agenet-like domain-containing protein n=1 Tax=Brassica napus TaxID=3708 RepID=A0ABQ7XWA9_BRANA|nr:LOW QUALITY PROTEIN: hypothetical protein HID58_088427 [Brassica napus]